MSSPNRTFVLQAVGVAVVIGVIFFAFLRPTDVGELSGIDAPGDDGPTFGIPGDGRERGKDARGEPRSDDRASNRTRSALTSASASGGGPAVPPAGDDPAGDQYTSTATALMSRVRAPVDP
jgi:hypothetical protein